MLILVFCVAALAGIVLFRMRQDAASLLGARLADSQQLADITARLGMVAEGVKTTLAVHDLAARLGVEAPITDAVHSILFSGEKPADAMTRLMTRTLREE